MTFSDYQIHAQRTSNPNLMPAEHLINAMLGLAGEAGECADLVKKHNYQDGRPVVAALKDELGDVLWYVAEAASCLGLNMDDIADANISKLRARYPDGFSAERSLHREV